MNRNRCLSWLAAVLLFLSAGLLWAQQSDQPSLADVAKHKPAAKAKKVITNDEIPPSPEANNPPPSPGSSAAGEGGSAPGSKADAKKAVEKPAMSAEKNTKLQELMKEHDSLVKVIAQLQQQVNSTGDPNRIESLAPILQHAKENLAANEAEIDKLKASGAAQSGASPPPASPPQQAPPPPK